MTASNDAQKLLELETKILNWRNNLKHVGEHEQLEKGKCLIMKLAEKIPDSYKDLYSQHVEAEVNGLNGDAWSMLTSFLKKTVARLQLTRPQLFISSKSRDKDAVCYKCGKSGHLKKDCSKKDSKGNNKQERTTTRKPRPPPKHRKHHCAYHKAATDRFCTTWSCPSVKYTQYNDRIKLLKENGDCQICCGDCPSGNCQAKTKRICGGGKDGRGCGLNHVGHELWCANAKVCFAVSGETVMRASDKAVLSPKFD